jgi:hypothetical protein
MATSSYWYDFVLGFMVQHNWEHVAATPHTPTLVLFIIFLPQKILKKFWDKN